MSKVHFDMERIQIAHCTRIYHEFRVLFAKESMERERNEGRSFTSRDVPCPLDHKVTQRCHSTIFSEVLFDRVKEWQSVDIVEEEESSFNLKLAQIRE